MALKFYGKGRAEQILGIRLLPFPLCPKPGRGLCMASGFLVGCFFVFVIHPPSQVSYHGWENHDCELVEVYFILFFFPRRKMCILVKRLQEFFLGGGGKPSCISLLSSCLFFLEVSGLKPCFSWLFLRPVGSGDVTGVKGVYTLRE